MKTALFITALLLIPFISEAQAFRSQTDSIKRSSAKPKREKIPKPRIAMGIITLGVGTALTTAGLIRATRDMATAVGIGIAGGGNSNTGNSADLLTTGGLVIIGAGIAMLTIKPKVKRENISVSFKLQPYEMANGNKISQGIIPSLSFILGYSR